MKYYSTFNREALDLMENLFGGDGLQWQGGTEFSGFPHYRAKRDEEGLKVEFELSGVEPDKANIAIDADLMKISGEKMEFGKDEAVSFEKTLKVPSDLNPDKIEAELKNGLLRITIPKFQKAEPKQIEISVS